MAHKACMGLELVKAQVQTRLPPAKSLQDACVSHLNPNFNQPFNENSSLDA